MEAPLALYRRYRPETFAEVIGQDHVTEPLRAALANNRVNHAYLFSGPRGCGKTTSARILARSLNCEKAPVADPCGECDSCRDLARGGPGSIDVIEIDAASHGGVDDARDLREKAFFAPVKSRYKVYIIDEAHMVTTQGFNALLKLVEEPPPHLRFIFATTEPEKVIPTIRSRTHHYPFRLIPPRLLSSYLAELCDREGVTIEQAALPLVVRAGGGSARDTLSVLDQLLGGAGAEGVTHALATGLLGYTPDSLLDEVVEAFAASDGAAVFGVVDKVVETGQDPRRFTEDLLRRLRDLVIVAAVPDAPASGLIDVAEDAGERLVAQAARFGVHDLSRAADLVAAGLTEMRGATAPRLLLELICARVLLPGADDSTDGLVARLDRLERRLTITPTSEPITTQTRTDRATPAPAPTRPPEAAAAEREQPQPFPAEPSAAVSRAEAPAPRPDAPAAPAVADEADEAGPEEVSPAVSPVQPPAAASAPAQRGTGNNLSLVDVRRLWPDIVDATKLKRRVTWIHLTQHAQVVAVDDKTLTLGFGNAGARESFVNGGSPEIVRQAAIDVVGADWRVEAIVDPGATPGAPPPQQAAAPSGVAGDAPADTAPHDEAPAPADPPPAAPPEAPTPRDDAPPAPTATASPEVTRAAREAIVPTRTAGTPAEAAPRVDVDADAHRDDPDIETSGLAGAELLQRELGAQIIHEIKHD
nr:DNA polymerase III subunit gamma and tau [Nocardioides guangzhouensis]